MKYSLLNSGYVPPYYDVISRIFFSCLIMVLVSSSELVLRKSSFVILAVYDASWRDLLTSQSRIPLTGRLVDVRVDRMYIKILDFLLLLLS